MIENTCDLYDRYGEEARVIAAPFLDFGKRSAFSGDVITIKCFEDNSRLKEIVATPGHRKVLVVDGEGSLRTALMGDMLAREAAESGWEGVIIFGCVRDRAMLRSIDLGVKALGATPRKSVRRGLGTLNVPIEIAGTWIEAGDYLVADEDGIIILDSALRDTRS